MQMVATFDDSTSRRVTVQMLQDNQSIESKVISFGDFLAILNESAEKEYDECEIGKLPRGYYNGALFPNYESSFRCNVVVPAGIFPVLYFDSVYMIPFPSLVFCFKVIQGRVNASKCYAIKDEMPTDDTQMYRYPFGNVGSTDGHICWGSNDLKDVRELADVDRLVTAFFGAKTNNDLYSPEYNVLKAEPYVETLRAFYEHLNGKDEFPLYLLNPYENLTLGKLKF